MHYHAEVWVPEKPRNKKHAEAILSHMLSSYHEETGSKNAFYDFYSIGGRWTGAHDDYDPASNPLNYKACWLCNGSGVRPNTDCSHSRGCNGCSHSRGCNGCGGTGMELNWPTEFVFHQGDMMSVEEAKKLKPELDAYTLIIAPTGKRKRPQIVHMEKWDGKTFVQTGFDGQVFPCLKKKKISGGYLITLDYHS